MIVPAQRIALRPWSDDDLTLLQRLLGDPAMMTHLGGPESPQAIEARHQRYLHPDSAIGGLFAIAVSGERRDQSGDAGGSGTGSGPGEAVEAGRTVTDERVSPAAGRGEQRVGWVGYWETDWHGGGAWEAGWNVLPAYQGRGVATAATFLMLRRARDDARFRFVYAFPRTGNAASNALCRRLGFELLGIEDVEYPPGCTSPSGIWRLDLSTWRMHP